MCEESQKTSEAQDWVPDARAASHGSGVTGASWVHVALKGSSSCAPASHQEESEGIIPAVMVWNWAILWPEERLRCC